MKNAILVHGKPGKTEYYDPGQPSASNSHWFPWLQKQLLVQDILAHTPEMPNSWRPHYGTWKKEFERYDITPETILVGHSRGGAFLVRWLSEHPDLSVGKVVLVAPSMILGPEDAPDFLDFQMDAKLTERIKGLTIFHADDDMDRIHKSVEVLRRTINGVAYREFHGYGHFTRQSMETEKFPELLQECLA